MEAKIIQVTGGQFVSLNPVEREVPREPHTKVVRLVRQILEKDEEALQMFKHTNISRNPELNVMSNYRDIFRV